MDADYGHWQGVTSTAKLSCVTTQVPEKWRLPQLFGISSLLGFVAVASSILLLYFGLAACSEDSTFSNLNIVRTVTADRSDIGLPCLVIAEKL